MILGRHFGRLGLRLQEGRARGVLEAGRGDLRVATDSDRCQLRYLSGSNKGRMVSNDQTRVNIVMRFFVHVEILILTVKIMSCRINTD